MRSPDLLPIEEIGLDSHGCLYVRPVTTNANEFAYIYRDASGVRWSNEVRALHAAEPERWEPTALYLQIIDAVRREYGIQLLIKPETRWTCIPGELRASIQALRFDDR
jgi:hypothetical protein